MPVVVLEDAASAIPLAEALLAGGIPGAEITLRTSAGRDAIAAVAGLDGFTVGAGTVITLAQLKDVVAAGARFAVSPGYDPVLVDAARALGIDLLPGVATPTELQRAVVDGVDTVKLFPAARLGGLEAVRDLSAPFPGVRFVPSGGVSAANAGQYLAHPMVPAVCGSWMVPTGAIAAGDFAAVERLSRDAIATVGAA